MEAIGVAMIMSVIAFDLLFAPGNWWGFMIFGSIMALCAAAIPGQRRHPVRLTCLIVILAGSIWIGWRGYQYQRAQVRLAENHYATCAAANVENPKAVALRAKLDDRAVANFSDGRMHNDGPAESALAKFIVPGEPVTEATKLARDTGYYIATAPKGGINRSFWSKTAFVASCDYAPSLFGSEYLSIRVHFALDNRGNSVVSNVEAGITPNSL